MGAEGMTQWLRAALTTLARDLSLVVSTHMRGLTMSCNVSFRKHDTLF